MTAVEWLAEVVAKMGYISTEILEQAKAMEKQQIENAFNYGQFDLGMEADEYYNQNFKSE